MNIKAEVTEDFKVVSVNGGRVGQILKRVFDVAFSLWVLFWIWPLMLLIAIAIKVTSKGPVLFKQERGGLNGEAFQIYKFRTMKIHQEEPGVVTQARKNDDRVTWLGAFLRRHSIDELPQFFNVVKGDMSVVGPRPHAIEHNEHYRKLVPGYMDRHLVKPGLTGLAQVKGCRGETETVEKMLQRVGYDFSYIRRKSLFMDFYILMKTPGCIFAKTAY